jgi:cytochrome c oxidase cbb3-type subunit 3
MGATALGLALAVGLRLHAQAPAPQAPPTGPGGPEAAPPPAAPAGPVPQFQEPPRFPAHQRPQASAEVIARGKAQYAGLCSACHGGDARGGQLGGPNLLRSQLVLDDREGELILPVVQQGRPGPPPMPPIPAALEDIKAVVAFLHSLQAQGTNQGGPPPGSEPELDILVGNAKAGEAFFAQQCAGCHSVTGDLQGIATRAGKPMALQNLWVSGGRASGRGQRGGPRRMPKPATATVTLASGEKVSGQLVKLDDFLVTLQLEDGPTRSIRRSGATPKIEVQDPIAKHRELLGILTNATMHDVTAYLATLK